MVEGCCRVVDEVKSENARPELFGLCVVYSGRGRLRAGRAQPRASGTQLGRLTKRTSISSAGCSVDRAVGCERASPRHELVVGTGVCFSRDLVAFCGSGEESGALGLRAARVNDHHILPLRRHTYNIQENDARCLLRGSHEVNERRTCPSRPVSFPLFATLLRASSRYVERSDPRQFPGMTRARFFCDLFPTKQLTGSRGVLASSVVAVRTEPNRLRAPPSSA